MHGCFCCHACHACHAHACHPWHRCHRCHRWCRRCHPCHPCHSCHACHLCIYAMHAMRAMHVMTLPGYFSLPGYPVACRSPKSRLQFVTRSPVTLARLHPGYYPLPRKIHKDSLENEREAGPVCRLPVAPPPSLFVVFQLFCFHFVGVSVTFFMLVCSWQGVGYRCVVL